MRVRVVSLLLAVLPLSGQTLLDDAYAALRANELERASALFHRGLAEHPDHLIARKDYAYTLLKLGETEAARNQFGEVSRRDPADFLAALEYGFLCHETRQRGEARRVFDRTRRLAQDSARETAEKAFQSVDGALAAGISQWSEAAKKNPHSDSVHEELARLAEERGDLELAERHYAEAWKLKPAKRQFLLDLGRVRLALGRADDADAALLAAARSSDTRLSEQAGELLVGREPSPAVLAKSVAMEPKRALATRRTAELSAIEMADRSYQLGYFNDALRYYQQADESAPGNPHVALRLGWVNNLLGRDELAYRWFGKARRSDDPAISAEAQKAWFNLREDQANLRPTLWAMPMYSSRWNSGFIYGQTKIDFRVGKLPLRPYLSIRFVGDTGAEDAPAPLSERSITPAAGVSTKLWHGMTAWAEVGGNFGHTQGFDSRAGVFHGKGFGRQLGDESAGAFYQITNNINYASRFSNDVLFSSQHRAGWTIRGLQAGWLVAGGTDTRQEYWANYIEMGATVKVRLPWLRPATALTVDVVRGRNFVARGNPRKAEYYDVRVGLWYALTY